MVTMQFPFGDPPFDIEQVEVLSRPRYGTIDAREAAFYEYMVRQRRTAWWARQRFSIGRGIQCADTAHSSYRERPDGPVWCFTRFGRTVIQLPFGVLLYTGGEHEDFYDPDFCIYNDVVVEDASGNIEVHGYPKDVFPPTDFHSATLVGTHLWLIGSLGYADLRRPGETQVLRLDTETMCITPVATDGDNPGWISRHSADYDAKERTIIVRGGEIWDAEGGEVGLRDNLHAWALSLDAQMWWRMDGEA